MNLKTKLENFVSTLEADAALLHGWGHGDSQTVVQTEGGPVRSPAKLIADQDAAINVAADGLLVRATQQANASAASAAFAEDRATAADQSAHSAAVSEVNAAESARQTARSEMNAANSASHTDAAMAQAYAVYDSLAAVQAAQASAVDAAQRATTSHWAAQTSEQAAAHSADHAEASAQASALSAAASRKALFHDALLNLWRRR